ncbi:MAG: MltA domain-containing protein [Phycisphaerales bacterium]|nr:MltA domain-containing protein [Phycisphaerales bacterium]
MEEFHVHRLRSLFVVTLATMSLLILGCPKDDMQPFRPVEKDYGRPLGPGEMALRKIGPDKYPDFSRAYYDRAALIASLDNSLAYLAKPSSKRYFPYLDVSHDRAVASLRRMRELLETVSSPQELDATIKREFEVYQSVGCDDQGTVFFTGYYCPIFEGRRRHDSTFRFPLYRKPPDLVVDSEGMAQGRRTPEGAIVPYYTRREIEEGGVLNGLEIAFLKDPFEAYVATVQGSTKLRLADGSLFELGYGGNNGHQYESVAKRMVADGALKRSEISLQAMLRYFAQHPRDVWKYTWQNPRYVFFQERAGGPYGSLNVPVTPYYSLATDKTVFPRACMAFFTTELPDPQTRAVRPYASFTLDQDTGGAIRAAGRSDIYIGIGAGAEAVAGRIGAEGKLYYMFVK